MGISVSQKQVRYNLTIPNKLYKDLQEIAGKKESSVAELLRRGIKWELLFDQIKEEKGRVYVQLKADSPPIEVMLM